jgi:hypothetical protein
MIDYNQLEDLLRTFCKEEFLDKEVPLPKPADIAAASPEQRIFAAATVLLGYLRSKSAQVD